MSRTRGEQEAQEAVKARWEHYAHGADIGVRGIGRSMAEAFEQAAVALAAVITEPSRVDTREEVTIKCEAPDPEVLLVDWLNALIYEMAVRRMILVRSQVSLEGTQLRAKAWGEEADVARHEPAVEIKRRDVYRPVRRSGFERRVGGTMRGRCVRGLWTQVI